MSARANATSPPPLAAAVVPEEAAPPPTELLVVAHRLPGRLRREEDGLQLESSAGGLVTALAPVLESNGAIWIGSPGVTSEECAALDLDGAMRRMEAACGCRCRAVVYPQRDRDDFYCGFSNEIVWPLFHDLVTRCRFDPGYWTAYQRVNRQFADRVGALAGGSLVWVHDYHLMRVATELKRRGSDATMAFFLHIPFPSPDILAKLPWREEVVASLVDFDLCGFQTSHDLRNFAGAVDAFLPGADIERSGQRIVVRQGRRTTWAGAFPIGIEASEFEAMARADDVRTRAREIRELHDGAKTILGVDRLDYTKGVPERLMAFDRLLDTHPGLRGEVVLYQQLVPSREAIPEYAELRAEIEGLISKINGKYTVPGWTPISYRYGSVDRRELVAMYRAADIALITPLRDGMNLVSLEFCASHIDDDGVLILSEFAGAAEALADDAVLVNPFDGAGMCTALWEALCLPPEVVRARMQRMRALVGERTARSWAEGFLATVREIAGAGRLERDGAARPAAAGNRTLHR